MNKNKIELKDVKDLTYDLYVKQKIEKGLKDIEDGRVYTTEELIKTITICWYGVKRQRKIYLILLNIQQLIQKSIVLNYVIDLINYTNLLDEMNRLGVRIQNLNTNREIRQLIYKSHKIIYEKYFNQVHIIAVIHTKRNFKKLIIKYLN